MAYDIPSISELEAIQLLNKHYAEVITSKKDGIASGADITQTTNPITGIIRRTLYKILDDMDDTFLERLLKMAFTPVGTFTSGFTITDARQTLLWEVSKGGDGHYYSWSGSFPKVVSALSSPSPIASGAWVDRTDDALRDQLAGYGGATKVGTSDGRTVQERFYNIEAAAESVKPYVDRALSDLSTAANKFYPTLAEANADIANINVNQPVTVGEAVNGGLWYKATVGATTLTKSVYDPLTQAKAYTDTSKTEANAYSDSVVKPYKDLSALRKSTDTGDIAVLVDSVGKILIGYDTVKDEPIIPNLKDGSTALAGNLSSVKRSNDANNIAALVDNSGNVLLGYDVVNDVPIIANYQKMQSAGYKTYVINHFLFYGQSLSVGATSTNILSTTQPYNNTTFNTGPRQDTPATSVIPLVEQFNNPSFDGMTNRGETPCSGAANYASRAMLLESGINPQNHVIFASTVGHGGYAITQLTKGTAWYTTMLDHVAKAKTLNSSESFGVQVVGWLQGETDQDKSTAYQVYLEALRKLQADMKTSIASITGQDVNIPFITYQCSYKAATSKNIPLAQLALAQEKKDFFLSCPTYRVPYFTDNTHLTNVGYKLIGAYFGRAYKQYVIDHKIPDFINPKFAKVLGNKVEVVFDVPKEPLVIDATNLASTTNSGFKVLDNLGAEIAISNVSASANKVTITLSTTPTQPVTVRYALDYLGTGLLISSGASGNLRDSTTETVNISGTDYGLFHVCPHFEMTAQLDKGI